MKALFTFLLVTLSYGQIISYSTFQTLPFLKRKTILTKHFRIIYPESLKEKAELVANSLEQSFAPLDKTLKVEDETPIDLILQNQSAQSNGYVALAPFRSEWEALPIMNNALGSTNWYLTLAIHEQRHIHQFMKYKRGFSKAMYYLFGDSGTQIALGISTPRWLLEGDAVYEETRLTKSGRGRIANFHKQFRALKKAKVPLDYNRVFYGSYDESMPGAYTLGYLLNYRLRTTLNNGDFDFFIEHVASRSWSFYAVDHAVERFYGKEMEDFYQDALNGFYKRNTSKGISYERILSSDKEFMNEVSYNKLDGKNFLYKIGFFETGGFYLNNKLLFRTNSGLNDPVRIRQNKFAFNDITVHPRFGLVNYSNIYVYDLKNKKAKKLTEKGQFFLSEISPDGLKVASVFFNKSMDQYIYIHSLEGKVLKKLYVDKEITIKGLSWNSNEKITYSGIHEDYSSFIKSINLKTLKINNLYEIERGVINDLFAIGETIYFSSDVKGKDDIYLLDKGVSYKITNSQIAARFPFVLNERIYFSDYSYKGFKVSKINEVKKERLVLKEKKYKEPILYPKIKRNYQEKEFNKKNFRFHSWSYLTSLLSSYNGVLSITGSDNLNENQIILGLENNFVDGASKFFMNYDYQKYWPIFHLGTELGKRSEIIIDEDEKDQYKDVTWKENAVYAGVTLPFRRVSFGKNYSMRLTSLATYKKVEEKFFPEDEYNGELKGSRHKFNFSMNTLRPYARFIPRFLLNIKGEFAESRSVAGDNTNANIKYLGMNLALPGFFKTGSFFLKYDHQEKTVDRFNFDDLAFFPREYRSFTFERLDTASLNYAVSLFYPDYNLWDVINFKRIRMNLFHDYALANKEFTFNSTGLEMIFDLNLFRLTSDIGVGVRAAYLDRNEETEYSVFLESVAFAF